MCALAKEPGKRFVDVVAMGDAFRDLLESTEGAMATMPEMEAVQKDDNALHPGQPTMAAMAAPSIKRRMSRRSTPDRTTPAIYGSAWTYQIIRWTPFFKR